MGWQGACTIDAAEPRGQGMPRTINAAHSSTSPRERCGIRSSSSYLAGDLAPYRRLLGWYLRGLAVSSDTCDVRGMGDGLTYIGSWL
jgi:hypothetical protein